MIAPSPEDATIQPKPGQIAYNAYSADSGGVSLISGARLPAWADLKPEIRKAWDAAALAVVERFRGVCCRTHLEEKTP